jgi:Icc protein
MPIQLPPISRRSFLSGGIAISGHSLLQRCASAATDRTIQDLHANRIALLADTHVSSDPTTFIYGTKWPGTPVKGGEHEGVNMAESLGHVVQDVLATRPRPAHAIVNGDCANDTGTPGEYREFLRLIEPLRKSGITVHVTIGNHDNRANLWNAAPGLKLEQADRHVGAFQLPAVEVVLLDSEQGTIGESQFQWLEQHLARDAHKPAIVFFHYNPQPHTEGRPIDGFSNRDGEILLTILQRHRRVKAYFYGHTHNWSALNPDGLHAINQPCVGPYFAKGKPYGWVDMRLRNGGAHLELRCVDPDHPNHGERHVLGWRT